MLHAKITTPLKNIPFFLTDMRVMRKVTQKERMDSVTHKHLLDYTPDWKRIARNVQI